MLESHVWKETITSKVLQGALKWISYLSSPNAVDFSALIFKVVCMNHTVLVHQILAPPIIMFMLHFADYFLSKAVKAALLDVFVWGSRTSLKHIILKHILTPDVCTFFSEFPFSINSINRLKVSIYLSVFKVAGIKQVCQMKLCFNPIYFVSF